jgi:epoxyqueuosine reductase
LLNSVGPYLKRPKTGLALFNVIMPGDKVGLTCGNCQLICHPDKEVRKHRYKLLVASGVITQNPDGSLEAVTPEEAQKRIAEMDAETRTLYELAQDPETG